MYRVVLGVLFFLTSSGLIGASTLSGLNPAMGEIFRDLGTEIFGILVTIALVDWVLEKRRLQDRARELAWEVIHEVEQAVWVWQGGPQHMGTNELLGILSGIQKADSFKPFTERLLVNVGLHCRSVLQVEARAIRSLANLKGALENLVSLATIRDLPDSTRIRAVAEILDSSAMGLARILGQPTDRMPAGLIWHLDASPGGQEARYGQLWSPGIPQMASPGPGHRSHPRTPSDGPQPAGPSPG